jgi:hypothetical protein
MTRMTECSGLARRRLSDIPARGACASQLGTQLGVRSACALSSLWRAVKTPFFILIVLAMGCGISPAEEQARREALAAEGRALQLAADAVEARLLAGEVRMAVWSELRDRHQQVSEVSCRVADVHFQDMARLFEEQAEKGRGKRRMHALASSDVEPAGIGGPLVPLSGER